MISRTSDRTHVLVDIVPMTARYGIYFIPAPTTSLATIGAAVLGRDVATGSAMPHPPALITAFPHWPSLVAPAAHYGFHATLKAPFALASRVTVDDLMSAVQELSMRSSSVDLGPLGITAFGNVLALTPATPTSDLAALERRIVIDLDHLRAPLDPSDRARRRPERLTERQCLLLDRYGYHLCLDEFRLHMTLTGPLPEAILTDVATRLSDLFRDVEAGPVLDRIAVVHQPHRTAAFTVLSTHPLSGPS